MAARNKESSPCIHIDNSHRTMWLGDTGPLCPGCAHRLGEAQFWRAASRYANQIGVEDNCWYLPEEASLAEKEMRRKERNKPYAGYLH